MIQNCGQSKGKHMMGHSLSLRGILCVCLCSWLASLHLCYLAAMGYKADLRACRCTWPQGKALKPFVSPQDLPCAAGAL